MSRPTAESVHSSIENVDDTLPAPESPLLNEDTEGSTMAAASKQARVDDESVVKKKAPAASSGDGSIFTLLYTVLKKVTVVGAVYLVGYMGWSVAWLITPVVLAVTREYWRNKSELRRDIAKASAMANEKDVILARIDDLPAWVYFPDVERCEWINRVLQQVWPNANHFAKDLVKKVIEPKVAKALSGYKLSGFQFDRIQLGTISPRIGGVKVYDKNTSRNEIILDVDLFYASDCDINFQLAGMRAGIKDFQIHGMMRVVMKPLIRKMPLVGGLQIFFLNNPDIDFNLVGVADLLDMPGLSDILRRIIVEQIGAIMVLPNKLPIALSSDVPAVALKMPEPEGVLRIHVVEAKDLMKKDISVLGKGKSDPYAIVTVGAQQFKTPTIDNTVNPKWDYWCEACIDVTHHTMIGVKLFDWDRTGDHDALGRASVEISNVVKNGTLDTWITLEAAKHGMLHLRFTWLKLSDNASDLQAALNETQVLRITNLSTAILCVYLDSACDLPQVRAQSKPDPFVTISLGKQSEQTSAVRRTDAPVWEQGYTFLVSNPANDTLHLKLTDQKTEKDLGTFTYVLRTLLEKPGMAIVAQPFQLQKSGPTSKITMSMALKVLKRASTVSTEPVVLGSTNAGVELPILAATSAPNETNPSSTTSVPLAEFTQEAIDALDTGVNLAKEEIAATMNIRKPLLSSSSVASIGSNSADIGGTQLTHRHPSTAATSGQYNLGKIQTTLRYSVQRQRLTVIIHKISNLPMKDASSIPDPYVKLYLLPGRSKETKRKTGVVKDNCNPVYDATFEYILSAPDLLSTELEVTVATQKGILSGGSPVIGIVKLGLTDPEIAQNGWTTWHDLLPESKFD